MKIKRVETLVLTQAEASAMETVAQMMFRICEETTDANIKNYASLIHEHLLNIDEYMVKERDE